MKDKKTKNKTKFEKYNKEEVITSKLTDFIQKQRNYRLLILEKIKQDTTLKSFKDKIEQASKAQLEEFEWLDCKYYPTEVAKCEYNIQCHRYGDLVSKLKQIETNLKSYGMTNEQLTNLINDYKIVKELPKDEEVKD
jgi:hypothetical protein